MAYRWQKIASLGTVSLLLALVGLFNLAGNSNLVHSPDMVCQSPCNISISWESRFWEYCFERNGEDSPLIRKKVTRGRRLWVNMDRIDELITTQPKVNSTLFVPARGKGNWRNIKEGDCLRRTTLSNPRPIRLRVIIDKEPNQIVKWSFDMDYWLLDDINIDPIIVGYEYIYEQKTREDNLYGTREVIIKGVCGDVNKSCTDDKINIEKFLIENRTKTFNVARIGVTIGEEEILGNVNIDGNILSIWSVPIGDRNFEEYGRCMPHELDKGVCKERKLI